jgi:putative ABC transport system permease protein
MFTRILLKSFRGRDSRQFVAFLSVVIATSVAATLLTIRADAGAKINVELRAYGANLMLVPANGEEKQTVAVSDIMQYPWPASDTIRGMAPILYGVVALVENPAALNEPPIVALGADFAAMQKVNTFWEIKPPITALSDNEILVGQATARKLGLSIGQPVTLRATATSDTTRFHVAGIVRTGENEDDQII